MIKRSRFWNYSFLVMAILLLLTNSCKKEKDPTTVTDIDGNVYHFVTIGTQVWMVENLNVTHYRNGDTISNFINSYDWNNTLTGAYRNYADNPANGKIYGKLYNFFSITDSRNLCPPGWHVPSDAEWRILREYLGGFNAGGRLKEKGTEHWLNPNTGAINSSGFTALPGGSYFDFQGKFAALEAAGYWWSSTTIKPYYAAFWLMVYDGNYMTSVSEGAFEYCGLSIRCLKD